MANEQDRVDAYVHTVERMEPYIAPVDLTAATASLAISAKRMADALEGINGQLFELVALMHGRG